MPDQRHAGSCMTEGSNHILFVAIVVDTPDLRLQYETVNFV